MVRQAMVHRAMAVRETLQATAVVMAEDLAVRPATEEARAMAGAGAATAEDLLIALLATVGVAAILPAEVAEATLAVVEEVDIPAAEEGAAIRAVAEADTPEAITKSTTNLASCCKRSGDRGGKGVLTGTPFLLLRTFKAEHTQGCPGPGDHNPARTYFCELAPDWIRPG